MISDNRLPVKIIKKKTQSPSTHPPETDDTQPKLQPPAPPPQPDNIEKTKLSEAVSPMTPTKPKKPDSDPVSSPNNDDPFDFDPASVDTSQLIPLFDKTMQVVQSNPLDEIRSDLRLESLNVHDNHEYWGDGNELYSLYHETSGDYLDFVLGYE